MGRDRLRRGYSLEVIFEEESDFCSQLDSLDTVPIGYLTTDTNNNRTQKDFSVIELLGVNSRPNRISNNWDYTEDSIDAVELNQQFSRTNTTRRTNIGQETQSLENKDMDSCFESHIDWNEPSSFHDCNPHKRIFRDVRELSPSSESQNSSSGRCSRVSRRQIVEANWLVMDEDDDFDEQEQIMEVDIRPSLVPCPIQYYSTDPPMVIIDAPLTKLKTSSDSDSKQPTQRSSEQEMDFKLDPHEIGSSKYIFPLSKSKDVDLSSESRSTSASSSSTDVKRVREIFETGRIVGSSSDDDENSNRLHQSQRFNKRNNPISSAISKSKLEKKISACGGPNGGSDKSIKTPLRSAYSQLSLDMIERYDYVDLLVNDNIIIEDSPDLFQTIRNDRNRKESNKDYWGSRSNLLFKDASDSPAAKSTLRRSKSVGTGIHNLEAEISESQKSDEGLEKIRPSIIAGELPARNTVRNVRSVFEQILRTNGHPSVTKGPAELRLSLGNSNGQDEAVDEKISPKKKALRSIKSNPTSKIFRSESLRPETAHYGTSVVLKCNPTKASTNQKYDRSNGHENSNLLIEELHDKPRGEGSEEDTSSNGTNNPGDENDEPKLISPDVLHRIRSLGTTTTYYGGEIVSKTVKNKKCPLGPRRNQTPDFCDEVDLGHFPASTLPQAHLHLSTEDFFLSSKAVKNPDRRPCDLHLTNFYDDTPPRIISVLPKSQSNSPTKSNSPVRSFLEGRNSPEGCESNADHQANAEKWINTIEEPQLQDFLHDENECRTLSNTGSGSNRGKPNSKKFSDAAEGVWF